MTEQFLPPSEKQIENEASIDESEKKKMEKIADKAASKSSEAEKKFDKEESPLYTH